MAYGTKYQSTFVSNALGVTGTLYIKEQDYTGSVTEVRLQDNGISVRNVFEDTETPIVGLRCEFFVLNDKANYFQLFELVTATERKFEVSVVVTSPYSATVFQGFLNTDTVSHEYLQDQQIRLVASSYLSKLEHLEPTLIQTKQTVTFINLIDQMLRSTGASFNIRVNCRLYAEGDTLTTTKTLFNLNGINTEAFWDSDEERKNGLEILEAILLPFNCFIYWWDGYWYIEQFTDIWDTNPLFVEYVTGTTYQPTDAGTAVYIPRTVVDVHAIVFKETTQTIKAIPGNRLISVRLNSSDSLLLNLLAPLPRIGNSTISLLAKPISMETVVATIYSSRTWAVAYTPPSVQTREWTFFTSEETPVIWTNSGAPSQGISNGATRRIWYDKRPLLAGLGTQFQATVLEDTSINISFTYSELEGELIDDIAYADPGELDRYKMDFNVYLGFVDPEGNQRWIVKSEDNNIWYSRQADIIGRSTQSKITITAMGTSFDRTVNGFPVSTSVPLGEVYKGEAFEEENYLVVNEITEFQLFVDAEELQKWVKKNTFSARSWRLRNTARLVRFGDITVSTSNDVDFNLIEGEINTDFLNKKEVEFFIGDNGNLNYTNGVLQGDTLATRTTEWNRASMTEAAPLIDIFFTEKFRMYNAAKQTLMSEVHIATPYRPFSLFTDSKQSSKKFILSEYMLDPAVDHGEVGLLEYDNDTEITLVDADE